MDTFKDLQMSELKEALKPKSFNFDVANIDLEDPTLAEWQYKKIAEQIEEFQEDLDDEHEVVLQLTNFGTSMLLNVTDIGFQNPCLIYYYGYVKDNYCQLIQHVSQINFLLMSCKKENPEKSARRVHIGFSSD